ncbi:MAG: hypothetical protein FWH40_09685 [Coriobacteriia bacterium]|nr:hypothetical protein [Coriobacteriia bacterium]
MNTRSSELMQRRSFVKGAAFGLMSVAASLYGVGCSDDGSDRLDTPATLLPASPDPNDQFGVDLNINMDNIDDYLNRDDVVYRDMRMFIDPADFGAIGGDPNLPDVLEGFKITPLPYLATLSALPVEGAYAGPCLLDVTRDGQSNIVAVKENYLESMMVINDLFPKDKPIFLACGGAGYSAEMKALLVYMGWDADKLYVIGPMWGYKGNRVIELIKYPDTQGGDIIYMLWRANYAVLDFTLMHSLG